MQTEFLPKKRPRLSRVGQIQLEPSIVLSVRPLPSGTSYVDLHDAFSRFGYISYASCIEGGSEGLVEFEAIESAKQCMSFSVQNAIGVKGQRVGVNYSEIKRIDRSEMESAQPTNALIIAVSNVKEVIDAGVISKICSPHGDISLISFFLEVPLKILVHFKSLESAKKAKRDLNGVEIYQGCCDMHVEFYSIGCSSASATNEFQPNDPTDEDLNQIGNQAEDHQLQCDTGNPRSGRVSDLNSEVVVPRNGDFCNTREEFGSHGFSSGGFSNSASKQSDTSAFSHNFSSESGNQAEKEISHNPDFEGFGNGGFATQGFSNSTQNGFSEKNSSREGGSNFRGRGSNFGKQGYNEGNLRSGDHAPRGFGTNDSNFRVGISRGRERRGGDSGQFGKTALSQNYYMNQNGNKTEDHQVQCDTGDLRSTGDFCNARQESGSHGFSSSGFNDSAPKTFNTFAFSRKFSSGDGNQAAQEVSHNPDFEGFGNAGFATQGFANAQEAFSEQSSAREDGSNFCGRGENFGKRGYNGGSLNSGSRAPRRFHANGNNFQKGISRGRGRDGENSGHFRSGAPPKNSYSNQIGNEAEDGQVQCNTGNLRGGRVSDLNSGLVVPPIGDYCNTRKEFGSHGFSSGGFSNSASKQSNTSAFSHNFSSESGNQAEKEVSHNPDFEGFGNAGFATRGFSNSTQNGFSEKHSSREGGSNFRGRGSNFGKKGYNEGNLRSGGRASRGFGTNDSNFRVGISRGRERRVENSGALSSDADASQNSSFASGGFSSIGFGSGGQYSDPNSRGNGRADRGRGYRRYDANGFSGNRDRKNQRNKDFN